MIFFSIIAVSAKKNKAMIKKQQQRKGERGGTKRGNCDNIKITVKKE